MFTTQYTQNDGGRAVAMAISQLCIPRCCLQYKSNMPRAHFDPKAVEVSIRNIVSNIYRNINKFLPNTIKYFTRQRLLQSYLLPIITRKDRSNFFYLYYRSFCVKHCISHPFQVMFVHFADAPTYCVARLRTVSTVLNFTK